MQIKLILLLIGSFSIANAQHMSMEVKQIEKDVKKFIVQGGGNPIHSDDELKLAKKRLGFSESSLVWKGFFNHHPVAVKISTDSDNIHREASLYLAANANDQSIENSGIPAMYYVGQIFGKYPVIVVSLFDETLAERWKEQYRNFNAFSTLQVFLQLTKALNYLHSVNIRHNDIKPENIFFRGNRVFLGDFDCATIGDNQTEYGTYDFGSTHHWQQMNRTYMDDLESLVFNIWHIEGINFQDPPGFYIERNVDEPEKIRNFVTDKCEHFRNFPQSYEACKFICIGEMLSGKTYPAYDQIITYLEAAVNEVMHWTGQDTFEWLHASYAEQSKQFGYPGEQKPFGTWNPSWL